MPRKPNDEARILAASGMAGRPPKYPAELIEEARGLAAAGKSLAEISEATGIPERTLSRHLGRSRGGQRKADGVPVSRTTAWRRASEEPGGDS